MRPLLGGSQVLCADLSKDPVTHIHSQPGVGPGLFRRLPVKFIVEAQKEEKQDKQGGCSKYTTMCADCGEDPRFCNGYLF